MDKRLIQIKKTREDRAQKVFNKKRDACLEADISHDDSIRTLNEYQDFREEEGERLFSQMQNQQVSLKDIEKYGHTLTKMKIKEANLNQDASTKLAKKNAAKNEKNMATKQLKEQKKAHEKFKELRKAYLKQQKIERHKLDETQEEETNELFTQSKSPEHNL